ncbi:redoxin domain-containing protein [Nonomuraea sp. B19D2]|uniref:TlpA family protein disulfide reductase n=1 Tax=Nonomuraea sp. B19D2 TaxID=3159561 RepID=UPI0032DBCBF9
MPYVVAATVAVGLLCFIDLVLTVGVIRRLREHTQLLAQGAGAPIPFKDMTLPVGASPPPYSALTIDGRHVSLSAQRGPTVVGFFMPGCDACEEEIPEYLRYAAELPDGQADVWAFVIADEDDEAAEVKAQQLATGARVIRETDKGPATAAFAVRAFPAFCVVSEDRAVTATAGRVADLPKPSGGPADNRRHATTGL